MLNPLNYNERVISSFIRFRQRTQILILKSILPFTWPIIVELTCVVLMGIVSTILVSRIGQNETAAVGISDSVTYIVLAVLTAIALGGSVLISQAFGKRHRTQAVDGASQVMNLSVLISVLACLAIYCFADPLLDIVAYGADPHVIELSALYLKTIACSYPALAITLTGSGILRAVGNSRQPAYCNIFMNLLNILFSYPLTYGISIIDFHGLGLFGAGIGITLARYAGAVIILITLARNSSMSVNLADYYRPFKRVTLIEILRIGIPASVESLMFNVGKLIMQMMVAGMGTVAMAGNVITFSAILFINIPGNALAMASTVLISRRLGQNKLNVATLEMKLIFLISTILLTLLAILSAPVAHWIASIYTSETAVIDMVVNLIYLNAIMMPLWAASFVLPTAFKGAKDVKYSMWVAIASMWGCRIMLGYLLGIIFNYGIYGLWIGMYVDWWVRAGCYFYRMLSRKWLAIYLSTREPNIKTEN